MKTQIMKAFTNNTDGSLEFIRVQNFLEVSPNQWTKLLQKSPKLRHLDIRYNCYYTDRGEKYKDSFVDELLKLKSIEVVKINKKLLSKEAIKKLEKKKFKELELYDD